MSLVNFWGTNPSEIKWKYLIMNVYRSIACVKQKIKINILETTRMLAIHE